MLRETLLRLLTLVLRRVHVDTTLTTWAMLLDIITVIRRQGNISVSMTSQKLDLSSSYFLYMEIRMLTVQGYNNGRGTSNDNQARLYPVEIECGSLPCPPFTQDRELQCAQCSFVGVNDTRPVNCEVSEYSMFKFAVW